MTKHNTSKVVVGNRSTITGKMGSMIFNMSATDYDNCFDLWKKGALIQNAFPMLNADEREFLMTGMTPDDWSSVVSHVEPSGEVVEDCYQWGNIRMELE